MSVRTHSNPIVYHIKGESSKSLKHGNILDNIKLAGHGIFDQLRDVREPIKDCMLIDIGSDVIISPRPATNRLQGQTISSAKWNSDDYKKVDLSNTVTAAVRSDIGFRFEDLYRKSDLDFNIAENGLSYPVAISPRGQSSIPTSITFDPETGEPVYTQATGGENDTLFELGNHVLDHFDPGTEEDLGSFAFSPTEMIENCLKVLGFAMRIGKFEVNLLSKIGVNVLDRNLPYLILYQFIDASVIEKKTSDRVETTS